MKRYLLCLFILLVGCKEQTEVINVYAINRLYSCEDTIYTTFKYDNDDKTQYVNGRKKSYDFKGNDRVIQNKIDLVIACIGEKMNSPQSPKCEVINGVIGAQFTLDFLDDDLRYAFEKEEDYPSCDIYSFRGYFKEKNKG